MGHIEDLANISGSDNVTAVNQLVIAALLTLDIHSRDVVQSLLKKGVSSAVDFEWIRLS